MKKITAHPLHRLFNILTKYYTLFMFIFSIAACVFWLTANQRLSFALTRSACVLIVTFPGALWYSLHVSLVHAETLSKNAGIQTDILTTMKAAFLKEPKTDTEKQLYLISRKAHHNIKEALIWTVLFTLISVPTASGYFYALGGYLPSIPISLLICLVNSLLLLANSWRLKKYSISSHL